MEAQRGDRTNELLSLQPRLRVEQLNWGFNTVRKNIHFLGLSSTIRKIYIGRSSRSYLGVTSVFTRVEGFTTKLCSDYSHFGNSINLTWIRMIILGYRVNSRWQMNLKWQANSVWRVIRDGEQIQNKGKIWDRRRIRGWGKSICEGDTWQI